MKQYNEITSPVSDLTEREIAQLFATWLKPYTHEVINNVLRIKDTILQNDFAMKLLEELHNRTIKEADEFEHNIFSLLSDFDTFSQYNPHNHALTHAGSYRDILYDMYIK